MSIEWIDVLPVVSGGGGAALVHAFSKAFMSREKRAEEAEKAERQERQMLMTIVASQAENLGYMKAEIDQIKTHHNECRREVQELRRILNGDTIPPASGV